MGNLLQGAQQPLNVQLSSLATVSFINRPDGEVLSVKPRPRSHTSMNIKTSESAASEESMRQQPYVPPVQESMTQYVEPEMTQIVDTTASEALDIFKGTNYLPSQEVGVLLSRSYKIWESTWNLTDADSANLHQIKLPMALAALTLPASILSNFIYFRCKGVEIEVKMQTTTMHFGALMLSWVPYPDGDIKRDENFYRRCNNRPITMSAQAGESTKMTVPWTLPFQWIRSPESSNLIAEVNIDVLNKLASVGATATNASYSVYARFIEPEVMGPTIPPSVFEDQSSEQIDATDLGKAGLLVDKAGTAAKGAIVTIKAAKATLSNAKDVVTGAPDALRELLFDKPLSIQANTTMAIEFGKDIMAGQGQFAGNRFALYPGASLTPAEGVIEPGSGGQNIIDLCKTPGLVARGVIAATVLTNILTLPVHCGHWTQNPARTTEYIPIYLSWFSAPFKYWRGAINYKFQFWASKFVSARIRITWLPGLLLTRDLTGRTGDVISRVIEINGDTEVNIAIPYADESLYKEVYRYGDTQTDDNINGIVQMELVSNMVSQVAAPAISYSIWKSAGEGFDLAYYNSANYAGTPYGISWTDPSPPLALTSSSQKEVKRVISLASKGKEVKKSRLTDSMRAKMQSLLFEDQCVIWEPSVYEPIIETGLVATQGYTTPESYSDINTLLRRSFQMQTTDLTPGIDWPTHPAGHPAFWQNGLKEDSCLWIMLAFRYYRGSERFKFIRPIDPDGKVVTVERHLQTANLTRDGPAYHFNPGNMQQDIGFEAPYFAREPFKRMEDPAGAFYVAGPTVPSATVYHSVGDDFSVGLMFSPPSLWVS
jgi:hypothetical protein